MPPFWSHQPVPWGGFPFCLFQPHSLCTLSCLWEICRGSGTDSNAVQQEMNTCNWPSLSYRNSRTSKSRTSSRHCLMDLSPQSLQGRLPGRGGYQGPQQNPAPQQESKLPQLPPTASTQDLCSSEVGKSQQCPPAAAPQVCNLLTNTKQVYCWGQSQTVFMRSTHWDG